MGYLSLPLLQYSTLLPLSRVVSLGYMSLKMLMINLFERVLKIFTPNLSGLQAHGHYFFIMKLNKGVTEGPDFPKVGGRRVVQSVGKGLEGGPGEGCVLLDCPQRCLSEEPGLTGHTAQQQPLVSAPWVCVPPHGDAPCQSPLLAPTQPKSEKKRGQRGGGDTEERRLEGRGVSRSRHCAEQARWRQIRRWSQAERGSAWLRKAKEPCHVGVRTT